MAHGSPHDLRVLLGLRLVGVVETDDLAALTGLTDVEAVRALEAAVDQGEVVRVDGRGGSGWLLTDEAEPEVRRRAQADVEQADARQVVAACTDTFLGVDDRVLEVARHWSWLDGGPRPNDHSDERYDHQVVQSLVDVHHDAAEVCAALGAVMDRFEPYGEHLHAALTHLLEGRGDWFEGDQVRSYVRVCGWLREDLLVSTGRWPDGVRGR